MNRLLLILFFLVVTHASLCAEVDSVTHCHLRLQSGTGYGVYRDLGASPLTYRGMQLAPGISLSIQNANWLGEAYLLADGGAYGLRLGFNYIQAYGGHPIVGCRALRNLYDDGRWRLWAGGSLDDLFDIRYNASLDNACVAFGDFARLNVEGRVEYCLRRWLLHAQMSLNVLTFNLRPGFAYTDNFDQDIASPTANTFDQYRIYPTLGTSVSTDWGATYMLANSNRIGISYRWSYLTSRTTAAAPHRFEYADHSLLVNLDLLLN